MSQQNKQTQPRFKKGQMVAFFECEGASIQQGYIQDARAIRNGEVIYAIDSPWHVATVGFLPEANIVKVLSDNIDDKTEPWMQRPVLYWNTYYGGGNFKIFPASEGAAVDWWLNPYDYETPGRYGCLLCIDELDFHDYVRDLFESYFDNSNPVHTARQRQDGTLEGEGFDWYGDNFYRIPEASIILREVYARVETDTKDFYRRFGILLEAVLNKAQELNDAKDQPNDFGILVVGP